MDLCKVFLSSILSVIVLFLLTKLMGKRQMAELSMFDYINGITIGSIAAEMATSLEGDILKPLVAMIVYALFAVLISFISCKSLKIRHIFAGKPIVLVENGKIYKENLKKAKLDLNEFLTQCRTNGYFNISDLDMVLLESNGKLSFLPVTSKKPATPSDLKINVEQEKMPTNLIFDGVLIEDNLKYTGNDDVWLKKQLSAQGIYKISDVFLAFCDDKNNLTVFKNQK